MKNRQEKPFTVTIKQGITRTIKQGITRTIKQGTTRNEMIDRLNLTADILSKQPDAAPHDVMSCVLHNGRSRTINQDLTRYEMIARLNLAADILSKRPETNARDVVICVLHNGRWGTCHRCPRDRAGALHPERCVNSDQKVHWSYYTNGALDSLLEALF